MDCCKGSILFPLYFFGKGKLMFDYYDRINILMMPTDACNMNCVYCYHEAHFSNTYKMTYDRLEHIMRITIPHFHKVNFIWHGGEPLLMGKEFYQQVLYLENLYNTNGCIITNSFQSNLTLLTEELADFFVSNGFTFGTSYDGFENEKTRHSSKQILKGREILRRLNSKCGCIMVISSANINTLIASYQFFNENNIDYKMNTYIKTDDTDVSRMLQLDEREYVDKVLELYDYWLRDINCKIAVNPLMNIIKYILFKKTFSCSQKSCLGKWLGIRSNGTITNCNRFFFPQYEYGNVDNYSDIREAFDSEGFKKILLESVERRRKCMTCEIYDYCNGGCNNVAMFEIGISNNGGFSCITRRKIVDYIKQSIDDLKMKDIVELEKKINPKVLKLIAEYQKN